MPAIDCPQWCDRDHAADWRKHVAIGRDPRGVPMADGTVSYSSTPEHEWLECFDVMHWRSVLRLDLPAQTGGSGRAEVSLQSGPSYRTLLYVDVVDELTATQARAFALGLLEAVDQLERDHAQQ